MSNSARRRMRANPVSILSAQITYLGSGQAKLTWTTALNPAGGWTVGRDGVDSEGTGPWSGTVGGAVRETTFNFLVTGSTYNFTVSGDGYSDTVSLLISGVGNFISNFMVTATTDTTVSLSWAYSGATLTNYTLNRGGSTIANPAAGATTYTDTGLTLGTNYSYALTGNLQGGGTTSTVNTNGTTTGGVGTGTWISGQSEAATTANGSFAAWRGRPVEIGGSWAAQDTEGNHIASVSWFVPSGAPYGNIPAMDWAIGAFLNSESGAWGSAASGAFDSRWTSQLTTLKNAWGARDATKMHIRFAHEFNGTWYPWSVTPGNVNNFKTAWARWANLVRIHFPGAKTVWCPNDGTHQGYDVRTTWPGDQYVDVVGVDYYNWEGSGTNNLSAFNTHINRTSNGGPMGIEQYRLFAAQHGKPIALCEWSNAASAGEAPNWFQYMYDWMTANGGTGPGNLLYDVVFNVAGYGTQFELYPNTYMPQSAAKYQQLW
ncbi:hypothetical protein IPL85_00920 [Candidatus Saccharibacteria bacterium]|nr:MAG: hypothetical protein IPL85_00920 [Candidatus Saccharibacteria bacterium]